jgi:hypothetical protein
VAENGGLREDFELKLNSHDLGGDIEFYDTVQRSRFEHLEARAAVVTRGTEKIFCASAKIRMLAALPHATKNACKFTNETATNGGQARRASFRPHARASGPSVGRVRGMDRIATGPGSTGSRSTTTMSSSPERRQRCLPRTR